jgi:hypothetical protein
MHDGIETAWKNVSADLAVRTDDFFDCGNTNEFGEAKDIANTVLFMVPDIRPSQSLALYDDTSAHSIPSAANPHSNTGNPPAKPASSRRTAAISNVTMKAKSHSIMRIAVADVDQGSVTATPTAGQSAIVPKLR